MTNSLPLIAGGLVLGLLIGYWVRNFLASRQTGSAEKKIKQSLEDAESRARKIVLGAEEKATSVLSEAKDDEKKRQSEIREIERRVLQREESLDKKINSLGENETALKKKEESLKEKENEVVELKNKVQNEFEKLSGVTREEAKESLFRDVKERSRQELAESLQKLDRERHEEVEKKGVEIMITALQRYARSHISEFTTTVFPLGNEEFKGKIIGREGRNIRALERATGVEFVIDEVPDGVVISSFDPFRREVARLALAKLVKDGRIQPAKIEEKVEEAKEELQKRVLEIGEEAAAEIGIYDLPKEVLQLLGRLHFRTSFGQNVLTHSIEMAHLAGMIGADLGLNVQVCKKGALLHDIGKAIDHEVEGTHVDLGRNILKKYEIDERVIQAMQSHHDEYPYSIPEAFIITAVDVLSAARPGARRGTLENYVKRLADLERIAGEFPGVKNSYAISAGRELRVFVIPEKIDDFGALEMARQIANRIQSELKYPGEVKVNVIREMRAVEYAK